VDQSQDEGSPTYDGEKFFTVRDGVRMATPLLVVIMMIGVVDRRRRTAAPTGC
jgi:hypothetical protein